MDRPHLNASITDLEVLFKKAREGKDVQGIATILGELAFRNTQRARQLTRLCAQELEQNLGSSNPAPDPAPPRPGTSPDPRPGGSRSSHKPTEEQAQAIDQFLIGDPFKINAFAGAGKTSTLEMMAQATVKRGQYIAFNKSTADDAKGRFPRTVNCSTVHGLAFRATPAEYKSNMEKMTAKVNAYKAAEILQLRNDWRIDKDHVLKPVSQALLILRTLRRFTQTSRPAPGKEHVPVIGALVGASESTLEAVRDFAVRGATHFWSRMLDPNDAVPLGHDGYLKLWAESKPLIAADFVLLDEAQDTNEVVLEVLRNQQAQIVYVGDKYQQIYEWRGAVNAMEVIKTSVTTYLTRSFRFGDEIAKAASRVLTSLGEHVPIVGNPRVNSRVGPTEARAVLARTNATTITAVIQALDERKRPHLVGGIEELMEMLRGVEKLKRGEPSTVPEFFGFENWQQVLTLAMNGEGDHLLTFVKLVEARGEKQLMWALNRTVEQDHCDLIISTAHKAKGREWPTVRLMDDFLRSHPKEKPHEPGKQKQFDPSELRLLYVAITRAKLAVEIPPAIAAMFGIAVGGDGARGQVDGEPLRGREGNSHTGAAGVGAQPPPRVHDPPIGTAWVPPVDWTPPSPTKISPIESALAQEPHRSPVPVQQRTVEAKPSVRVPKPSPYPESMHPRHSGQENMEFIGVLR